MTPRYHRQHRAFTLIELMIVIAVIAVLATIVIVAYNGVQRRAADAQTRDAVADALKNLQLHYATSKGYPSNLADTEYAPPLSVAVTLYTNSTITPVYTNLTPEQNAQLFLNACNGYMPITSGGTTYNTACAYNGNNAHIKGTVSSNVVISGPNFNQTDFALTCGPSCDVAQNSILSQFQAQGGSFPVTVPKSGSPLPAPTSLSYSVASDFCVEGVSANYTDIAYHAIPSSQSLASGRCPPNPSLHYP